MKQLKWSTNKWQITNSDVGSVVLLAGGEERKLSRSDVRMIYVVDDKKGDFIEDAPPEEADDYDTDDF